MSRGSFVPAERHQAWPTPDGDVSPLVLGRRAPHETLCLLSRTGRNTDMERPCQISSLLRSRSRVETQHRWRKSWRMDPNGGRRWSIQHRPECPFAAHSPRFGANGTQGHFTGLDRKFSTPFAQDRFFGAICRWGLPGGHGHGHIVRSAQEPSPTVGDHFGSRGLAVPRREPVEGPSARCNVLRGCLRAVKEAREKLKGRLP